MDEFQEFGPQIEVPGRRRGLTSPVALVRMLLVIGIAILCGYVIWRGGWLGVLAWLLTVIVLVDTSANVLFAIYNEPRARLRGMAFWVASIFMGQASVQIVNREGKVIPYRPAGALASIFARFGCPGFVVIDNGVAVVFERSGRFTRVHGPGLVFTQRFERIAQVVDLRRQVRTYPVEKIMTRDGLSFDLDRLSVIFDVAADFDPQKGEYSFSEEALLDLVYRGGFVYDKGREVEWGARVGYSIEYYLRNVAAKYSLAELIRGDQESARKLLLDEVEKLARPALREYGVRLITIDIGQIKAPEELRSLLTLPLKQVVDMGWAQTQRDAIIGISEGLKQAIGKIQAAMPPATKEAQPHLLLSLTDVLGGILQESLRLAASYREAPEGRALPAPGEGRGADSQAGHDVTGSAAASID